MESIDAGTPWIDRAFYFPGKLHNPVTARLWRFRDEAEYESDDCPESLAITLLFRVANCFERRVFLFLLSDAAKPTALRSKKGVLWDYEPLRQLRHVAFELDAGSHGTRLGAVVELTESGSNSAASAVLNWVHGLIVLADWPLDDVVELVKHWGSGEAAGVLPFDFDAIGESLLRHPDCGVLRYFPPDNGRVETVVVVAVEERKGGGGKGRASFLKGPD